MRKELARYVLAQLPRSAEASFRHSDRQNYYFALLAICEGLGDSEDAGLASRLLAFGESFRTPQALRRQAIRSYGFVARRDAQSVLKLIALLGRNAPELNDSVYAATFAFISECKKRVQSVRQIYELLPELLETLQTCWRREFVLLGAVIDSSTTRYLRNAIVGGREVLTQYEEFSVTTLAKQTSQGR